MPLSAHLRRYCHRLHICCRRAHNTHDVPAQAAVEATQTVNDPYLDWHSYRHGNAASCIKAQSSQSHKVHKAFTQSLSVPCRPQITITRSSPSRRLGNALQIDYYIEHIAALNRRSGLTYGGGCQRLSTHQLTSQHDNSTLLYQSSLALGKEYMTVSK